MGLDMHLKLKGSSDDVMYWRKSNAIHRWFVENVQKGVDDCGTYPVTRQDLENLLDTIDQALDGPASAEFHLPTARGCFFGATSYDAGYFYDLQDTFDSLTRLLNSLDPEFELEYRSSW